MSHSYQADDAGAWGGGAAFLLRWARHFYQIGETSAGDAHAATAYRNTREAGRRANVELDRQRPHPDRAWREQHDRRAIAAWSRDVVWGSLMRGPFYCG